GSDVEPVHRFAGRRGLVAAGRRVSDPEPCRAPAHPPLPGRCGMTAVDATILKLVEVFGDALTGWQVLDGWNGSTALADSTLIVGFNPTVGATFATSTVDPDDGGLDALVETVTVTCSAARWDGNMEFPAKRADLADA